MSLADEIRTVQRLLGVDPDGVAGPRTIEAMRNALDQLADLRAGPRLTSATSGPSGGLSAAGAAAGGPVAGNGALSDPSEFFEAVKQSFGPLDQSQVDGINALLAVMTGWPLAWTAYGLATSWHETDAKMQPIHEYGDDARFRRLYDIQGNAEKARELGNLSPGDGIRYAGRGFVQLTGKANYVRAGLALGIDLPENPDLALKLDVAAKILRWGMEGGRFTGKKLADYLPETDPAMAAQFHDARRIINGLDRADEIAAHAMKFQAALQSGGWHG